MKRKGPGDEFSLIERYFAPLAADLPGAFGLRDDAAALALPEGHELVVTHDMLVEGVHFLADDPPASIGWKLLAVNLSDLAAMGAAPMAYSLGVALPEAVEPAWLAGFAEGLGESQNAFGIALSGGDTVASRGPLTLSLTAFGQAPGGAVIRRSGACDGDTLYVSGTIGDGFLGLRARRGEFGDLTESLRESLVRRYRRPEPRVGLGLALRDIAHAAIDVSDGLAADLMHLCRASGVSATVNAADVPLSEGAHLLVQNGAVDIARLLGGGDDYELLFAAPEAAAPLLRDITKTAGVAVQAIGRLDAAPAGLRILDSEGAEIGIDSIGYRHF